MILKFVHSGHQLVNNHEGEEILLIVFFYDILL